MIISVFILLFGAAALVQFSLAYCRTLLMTYEKVELSAKAQEIIETNGAAVGAYSFHRLMVIVRLAPDPGDDAMEIRTVGLYYQIMRLAGWLSSPLSQRVASFFESELARCSYFAAVSLDRRLAVPA
ncbi:MAG: hypothetical protein WB780_00340 [Candidatus Acidiferrales bacterium]